MKSEKEIVDELKQRASRSTAAALAKELGISAQYLSDILHGRRGLGNAVPDALGLRHVEGWVPK